jgi:membrane fusion protein, multidrug efflux system
MQALFIRCLVAVVLATSVSACGDEPALPPEQPRPIRTFTVTDVAGGQLRRFSGLIEASDSSSLSFQIPGNVSSVRVSQGDTVRTGQVLATLDEETFRLAVQTAEAELQRARAYLTQARADFERHQRLLEQRAVAQVQFEVAQRNFLAAQSEIDVALARLDLARRDLRNTTLAAPFDGSIAARLIDPFVQVQAGQELFRIDAAGNRQAAIAVPETAIGRVAIGMPGTVSLPQFAEPIGARVTEIGSAAGAGNAFPVKLRLLDPPRGVRPGMTAEVTLLIPQDGSTPSYLVPLSAIAPGDAAGEGFVFIFDAASSTVRRSAVAAAGTMTSDRVAVSGLAIGDIVATAGVNFLRDGQIVTLMPPAVQATGR